jgi:secreted trypsin-like serine protease
MPHRERRTVGFWGMLGVLVVSAGCAARAPVDSSLADEPGSSSRPGTWPRDTQFFMLNAQEDTENRYLATLIVESEGSPYAFCSGVLLDPGIVLTAGHCVCVTSKSSDIVDSSTCAKRAKVTGYVYKKQENGYDKVAMRSYEGSVRAHSKFKARISQGRYVVESTTDLAAILLDAPMKGVPLNVRLPDSEVQIKELFTAVGYGLTKLESGEIERRYQGQNTVTGVYMSNLQDSDDGDVVFVFGRPGAHAYLGDSGGPCYREDKNGARWLVGIISRGTKNGTDSLFTSLYPHLGWLKELKAQVKKVKEM